MGRFKLLKFTLFTFILLLGVFFIDKSFSVVYAQLDPSSYTAGGTSDPFFADAGSTLEQAQGADAAAVTAAIDQCMTLSAMTPICSTPLECAAMQLQATKNEMLCISDAQKNNASLQNNSQWKEYAKRVSDDQKKQAAFNAIASAFKSSLSLMAKQLAVDSATWIASGGKGQQPLFITEGWGAYLQNIGDSALGDFIDQVGQRYGVDLCKSANLSLSIRTSINWKKPRKVRCTFSKMMTNWESAIKDANFAFEYNNYMNPGENDLSVFLKLSGESLAYVNDKVSVGQLDIVSNQGWKDVKDFANKILTPGTVVKEWLTGKVFNTSSVADEVFTGTVADFVNAFVQTLVGQLLNNFKSGLFTSSGSLNGNSSDNLLSGLALPDLSSLLDSEAQPYSEGALGAEARFNKLKQSEYAIGGPYQILSKLTSCPENAKDNPGPTDCVIDQAFSSYIKDKKQVWQVSDDFKKRPFAPNNSNSQNYTTAITYRTVLILRKYRIVPIGWEIAANYLKDSRENLTLGDIMDQFDEPNSKFYGLVDPYWVFKAPEVYCRRQGYGDHNTFQNSQDGSVNRDENCTDEQQCIRENENGSCAAYGYCTEERRFWNFGTTCDSMNNTCQAFSSRQGDTVSYLTNSLDYRNCNSQNAGCRWYSNLYDPISKIWRNLAPEQVNDTCSSVGGCLVDSTGLSIAQYHQVSNLNVGNIAKMAAPCSSASCTGLNHCTYSTTTKSCSFSGSCTIPYGASSCRLENCLDATNILSDFNADFEDTTDGSFLPKWWLEELSSGDNYTRDYRADGKGQGNSAGLVVTANNAPLMADGNSEVVILKDIPLENTTSTYQLKFFARADYFNDGEIDVQVYRGGELKVSLPLTSISAGWDDYIMSFDADGYATATIKIITQAGTTAQAYFDNFELKRLKGDCQENSVSISLPSVSAVSSDMYFNRNVQACNGSNEGCSQFIRTKAGLGSNFIYNGGFEFGLDGGWKKSSADGTISTSNSLSHSGIHSLSLKSEASGSEVIAVLEEADHKINLEKGKKYILSGWVYRPSGSGVSPAGIDLYQGSASLVFLKTNVNTIGSWQRLSTSFTVGQDIFLGSDYSFSLRLRSEYSGGNIYFDDIQLEEVPYNVDAPSAYSEYNPSYRPASQLAYLKKAPDYYNCYKSTTTGLWADSNNIFTILQNRNSICSKYAPVCTADEVGCELYTPLNGDPAVPGVAETLDVCPSECVGYQVYKQEETDFTSSRYTQFIADKTPKYCSAKLAGCDEFTNLDDLANGAEKREYYVHFQVCEKPGVNEGTYYTWEGNDTAGYQLKVYKLKKSNIDNGSKPCTDLVYSTSTGSMGQALCQDNPFNANGKTESSDKGYCTKDDMVANPDCREFYDANGNISHRLLSETITISSNCHPYRRTMTQATSIEAAKDCNSHDGFWNGNNECIYMAIPGEGLTCSVGAKGCRAYTGNTGNNVRNILNSNFDVSTDTAGWISEQNDATTTASISNVATFVGGHSLTNSGVVAQPKTLKHQVNISSNKTYILSFWAKADVSFVMDSIKFDSAKSSSDFFSVTKISNSNLNLSRAQISNEWREYELGPVFVNWDVSSLSENYLQFNLPAGARVYLNNIVLKEVQNSVYLVENSWYTPFSCDNNLGDGNGQTMYNNSPDDCVDTTQGTENHRCVPGNMLGCSAYRDRSDNLAYLKSFARLCRLEAAGCEKLIDTYNYDYPNGNVFNAGSGVSSIAVPKYSVAYLVTDEKYACAKSEKGCTAYGLPTINQYDEITNYSTTYLKNLPDRYETDICKFNELWCEEYVGQNSYSYFKNPHGKVCEYVKKPGSLGAWLQRGTEEPCTTTTNQTFGTGYEAFTSKIQPIGVVDNVTGEDRTMDYQGWVGACPTAQSGCNEYVDPLANIYTNLLKLKDYVPPSASGSKGYYFIDLDQNSLYSVSVRTDSSQPDKIQLGIDCIDQPGVVLSSPDSSMHHDFNMDEIDILKEGPGIGPEVSGRFYVSSTVSSQSQTNQSKVRVRCRVHSIAGDDNSIKIVKAGVYYKLSGSVNSGSCNGRVNFRTGCVLLNNRGQVDYSVTSTDSRFLKNLIFDAQKTYNEDLISSVPAAGTSPFSASNTANIIVSASADRTCSNWLTCNTYQKSKNDSQFNFTENDKCLGISTCQAFGEDGACSRIENSSSTTSIYTSEVDKNKTGYVMINPSVTTSTSGVLRGIINNPYDAMAQLGGTSEVVNGDFEMVFGSSSDPIGWVPGKLACQSAGSPGGKNCELVKPKTSSVTWNSGLFKVVYDPKRAESGSSYLQLNSGNIAISENIGVEAGKGSYYLSFWVNTTNLVGSGDGSSASLPYAEARFLFLNEEGQGLDGSPDPVDLDGGPFYDLGPEWQTSTSLMINQGVAWKHIVYKVTPPDGATDMRIALFNLAPDATNGFDNSKLGGYTMWDNIGVNTVLDTDGSSSGQLARTCRIYPAADAPGCRYNRDNTQYYGQYGYCMLKDPAIGSQQCLQWWPVDNIAGESVNDYSAFYQERMPLYYCIKKAQKEVSFINGTLNVNASNLGDYESAMQLIESRTGTEVKFFPFSNVPASMRTLLRYPYIYRFLYIGAYLGYNGENLWVLPMISFMKPYEAYGFAGYFPFYYPTHDLPGGSAGSEGSPDVPIDDVGELCQGGSKCGVCVETINKDEDKIKYCNPLSNHKEVRNGGGSSRGSYECDLLDEDDNNYDECLPMTMAACGKKNPDYVAAAQAGNYGALQGVNASGTPIQCEEKYDPQSNNYTANGCTAEQKQATCLWLWAYNQDGHGDWYDGGTLQVEEGWLNKVGDFFTDIGNWFAGIFNAIGDFFSDAFSLSKDDYWGGWAMVGFNIESIPVAFPLPWHTANSFKAGSGIIAQLLKAINDSTVAIGYTTFKIVSDEDGNYGGQAPDPHPDVRGDVLGYAMSQGGAATTDEAYGSGVVGGVISNGFKVEYCDQLVKVVDSSGQQKAYSARTSPGSSYKTSYVNDWDCVANGLYGDIFENAPDTFSMGDRCDSDSMDSSDCAGSTKYVTSANKCFDHSAYCLRINTKLGSGNDVPYNYCGNYYGKDVAATNKTLFCCGGAVRDDEVGHDFREVCNVGSNTVNPNYFCVDNGFIFANNYHLAGYSYNTDRRPFASLISPSTGQYPSEWDSKDDVADNQPLFYEGNMDSSGIGQARMGQVHDKNELKRLFAKSYGVWEWQSGSGDSKETFGRYVQTSGLDWSMPKNNCGGIGKREAYESSTPKSQCFNYPEITAARTTNSIEGREIIANSPLKLEFNVNVDAEQLPIRSYSVAWGDNTTTTFSGTALLARPATSDPFILYHYYGDKEVTGKIRIGVRDNWNKDGWSEFSTTSSDPLNNSYNLKLDYQKQQ